jgi:predicted permease
MLYGALIGVLLAITGWRLPAFTDDFFAAIRGTYSVLGMMMVGMGMAGLHHFAIDMKFVSVTFVFKFICWPLMAAGFVWLDTQWLHWYTDTLHDALMLLSLAPLAVMSVVFASLFNAHPEKMATAVFLSTCFALVYVPLMVGWLGLGG